MPYVSRDESGNITGVFANLQSGYAEEYLPDDDPEVIAFLEPKPQPPTSAEQIAFDHENRIRALEGQSPLTLVDFVTKLAKK
jgi:hypothetical protein